jgi:hypothetical protein
VVKKGFQAMEYNKIENEIVTYLKGLPQKSKSEGWEWESGRWTKAIKLGLLDIAKKEPTKYIVCANGIVGTDDKEWLYDMIWLENHENGGIKNVPLVMESELHSQDNEVDEDFCKLLVARADHRLWIFQRRTVEEIKASINACIQRVQTLVSSQSGDRYLFAGLSWNPRDFIFQLYVHA